MNLFLLEGTCLYWVINPNVNANFIALHLEDSRNTNITIQIAQTPRPSVFLRNFKQDTSAASSLPPRAAAVELVEVSRTCPAELTA